MSIQIDPRTKADLQFFFDGEFASMMGYKSSQGSIEDTLVRGCSLGSTGTGHGISLRAINAATRLKSIQGKLLNLTQSQIGILSLAFRSGRNKLIDSLYGLYPRVALLTAAAHDSYLKEQPGQTLERLEVWLSVLAHEARTSKAMKDRLHKAEKVGLIRLEAEEMLADALQAYGSKATVKSDPTTLSMRELAKRLHMDTRTIAKELSRRGIQVTAVRGRNGSGVSRAQLSECWTEIAEKLL